MQCKCGALLPWTDAEDRLIQTMNSGEYKRRRLTYEEVLLVAELVITGGAVRAADVLPKRVCRNRVNHAA